MITNKQKTVLSVVSFVTIVIGIFTVLPLKILFDRMGIESQSVELIELIIKFIVLPLGAIATSLYFMKLRKQSQEEELDVSVAVIKMCYIPIAIYISGLMGWLGGVIYASIPFAQNMVALICIIICWSISAILIILFGIYTDWLNNFAKKGMLISNIIYIAAAILIILGIFIGYKKIEVVKTPSEVNAFVQIAVYIIAFFVMLLFLWKSIYGSESAPVSLENAEEITEDDKVSLVVALVEEEVLTDFDEYYTNNCGKYINELKAIQAKEEELADGFDEVEEDKPQEVTQEEEIKNEE